MTEKEEDEEEDRILNLSHHHHRPMIANVLKMKDQGKKFFEHFFLNCLIFFFFLHAHNVDDKIFQTRSQLHDVSTPRS